MIEELNEIHKQIMKDPTNIPSEVKARFWKLVGQIKRTPNPDKEIVEKASEIRDLLYARKYGGYIPLWLATPIWFVLGFLCVYGFIYAVIHNVWDGIGGYRHFTIWWTIVFLYPFGRIIAGKFTGIKLDGLVMTHFLLPTFKVNYPSYLLTSPPKRQWFFFFAGAWTTIIAGIMGLFGYLIVKDMILFIPFIITGLGELVATKGIMGKWGGEMNNFHRERKVVSDWRKLADTTGN
jgi:hypothetical protein